MTALLAPALFVILWLAHMWLVEASPWRHHSLSCRMEKERKNWITVMATRDMRIVDTNIISGLQTGTGFFASTSLLAIGAAFTLLNSGDMLISLSGQLPFSIVTETISFEFRAIGMLLIYAYAFMKFGWSYRLFNYTSILMGAVPEKGQVSEAEMQQAIDRAANMSIMASREFNRGQRAFFVAIAYLGWFFGDIVFMITTLIIYAMMVARQFFSPARKCLVD
jgi:uncharacterized membrane protein